MSDTESHNQMNPGYLNDANVSEPILVKRPTQFSFLNYTVQRNFSVIHEGSHRQHSVPLKPSRFCWHSECFLIDNRVLRQNCPDIQRLHKPNSGFNRLCSHMMTPSRYIVDDGSTTSKCTLDGGTFPLKSGSWLPLPKVTAPSTCSS